MEMPPKNFKTEVEDGVKYLDAAYPQWWVAVDLTTLAACSATHSVLAQVTGKLAYETFEVTTWTILTLRMHGFIPTGKRSECPLLTAEWHHQIARIKDARK
jgi:hypothetical protein